MNAYLAELRRQLEGKIKAVHRQQAEVRMEATSCDHEWQTYRQTIIPDNPTYIGSDAHFVVKVCAKCKQRENIALEITA